MIIWTQVGERVEKIRKERAMSRVQFGNMIGVSSQYIGMVERGAEGLSVKSISKICRETGISADYLLFGIFDASQEKSMLSSLSGLSQDQIQIALDIVKKVAQFINTEDGNETLIKEVMAQQCVVDKE